MKGLPGWLARLLGKARPSAPPPVAAGADAGGGALLPLPSRAKATADLRQAVESLERDAAWLLQEGVAHEAVVAANAAVAEYNAWLRQSQSALDAELAECRKLEPPVRALEAELDANRRALDAARPDPHDADAVDAHNRNVREHNAGVSRQKDDALAAATDLVVVASAPAALRTPWVEAEWRLFEQLRTSRGGRGHLVALLGGPTDFGALPEPLRGCPALRMDEPGWEQRLAELLRR